MNLYLVFAVIEYEGSYLKHIATTKEKAEQFIEENKDNIRYYDDILIEEWQVDEAV